MPCITPTSRTSICGEHARENSPRLWRVSTPVTGLVPLAYRQRACTRNQRLMASAFTLIIDDSPETRCTITTRNFSSNNEPCWSRTICWSLSIRELLKSAPSTIDPLRSLLQDKCKGHHKVWNLFASALGKRVVAGAIAYLVGITHAGTLNSNTNLVRTTRCRIAFVRFASFITARSMSVSLRSAPWEIRTTNAARSEELGSAQDGPKFALPQRLLTFPIATEILRQVRGFYNQAITHREVGLEGDRLHEEAGVELCIGEVGPSHVCSSEV